MTHGADTFGRISTGSVYRRTGQDSRHHREVRARKSSQESSVRCIDVQDFVEQEEEEAGKHRYVTRFRIRNANAYGESLTLFTASAFLAVTTTSPRSSASSPHSH